MAKLTEAQERDFSQQITQLLKANITVLTAAGGDPTTRIAKLEALNIKAEADETDPTSKRVEAITATSQSISFRREQYQYASASVDFVSATLGKEHPLTWQMRNLRDTMINEVARDAKTSVAA